MINYISSARKCVRNKITGQYGEISLSFRIQIFIMDSQTTTKLVLVNMKGLVLPMTPEEYKKFLETREEWDN